MKKILPILFLLLILLDSYPAVAKDSLLNSNIANRQASYIAIGNYIMDSDKNTRMFLPVVYITNDGGEHWAEKIDKNYNISVNLIALSCGGIDNNRCVAVGAWNSVENHESGLFSYVTHNHGVSWEGHQGHPSNMGITPTVHSVSCDSETGQYCIGVGSIGAVDGRESPAIVISKDGGITWLLSTLPKQGYVARLINISCFDKNNTHCTAIGNYREYIKHGPMPPLQPIFYKTDNNGNSWEEVKVPKFEGNAYINSAACAGLGMNHCIAIGNATVVNNQNVIITYVSDDFGKSWIPYLSNPTGNKPVYNIQAASCAGDNGLYCVAVGYSFIPSTTIINLVSLISENGGITWNIHLLDSKVYNGAYFTDITCNSAKPETCLAVGGSHDQAILYRTTDGGESWQFIHTSTGPGHSINAITTF